jgi:hypothetical protein
VAALASGIALIRTHDSGGLRIVGVISTTVGGAAYVWASPIVHHLRGRAELSKVDIALRVLIPGLVD